MIDKRLIREISDAISSVQLKDAQSKDSKDEKIGAIAFSYHDALRKVNIARYNLSYYWFDGRSYTKVDKTEIEACIFQNMREKGVTEGTIVKHFSSMTKTAFMGLGTKELKITKRKLCFTNCILDVDTRETFPFSADHHVVNRMGYDYEPSAKCPKWKKFISEVLPDVKVQESIQEYLGLMFVDRSISKLEKMMVLIGTGSNGKSVVFETINAIIGSDNITTYEVGDLVSAPNKDYNVANIDGKILNYCTELNKKELVGSRTKGIISGEPTMARMIYKEPFMATQIPLIIANANELPATSDHTKGYFRRLLLIPFDVEITGARQNVNLHTELRQELPGIFNWILEGHDRVAKRGYKVSEPEAVRNKVIEYEQTSNSILMFLREGGFSSIKIYAAQEIKDVRASEFYLRYREYCAQTGSLAFAEVKFAAKLREKGFEKIRTRDYQKYRYYDMPQREEYEVLLSKCSIQMSREEFYRLCDFLDPNAPVMVSEKEPELESEVEDPDEAWERAEQTEMFSNEVPF